MGSNNPKHKKMFGEHFLDILEANAKSGQCKFLSFSYRSRSGKMDKEISISLLFYEFASLAMRGRVAFLSVSLSSLSGSCEKRSFVCVPKIEKICSTGIFSLDQATKGKNGGRFLPADSSIWQTEKRRKRRQISFDGNRKIFRWWHLLLRLFFAPFLKDAAKVSTHHLVFFSLVSHLVFCATEAKKEGFF